MSTRTSVDFVLGFSMVFRQTYERGATPINLVARCAQPQGIPLCLGCLLLRVLNLHKPSMTPTTNGMAESSSTFHD